METDCVRTLCTHTGQFRLYPWFRYFRTTIVYGNL